MPPGCYRLPTEAEWEYSARAGTTTNYSYGDDPAQLGDYAWYGDNSLMLGESHPDYGAHPGGQKLPNSWGLYDMHGNVSEWIYDWHASSYTIGAKKDPTGPSTGTKRVARGGSWFNPASDCTPTIRYPLPVTGKIGMVGFRIALVYDTAGG